MNQNNNDQFTEENQKLLLDIMRKRRDVRGNRFTSKSISPQSLSLILEAANLAPSVGYSQPWEFVTITDKTIKKQIKQDFSKGKQYCSGKIFRYKTMAI